MTRPATPHQPSGVPRRHLLRATGLGAGGLAVGAPLYWLWRQDNPVPDGGLTFATGVDSGVYARYGTLLRRRLARDAPELRMRLLPSQGSVHNIDLLTSGSADVTLAQSDAAAAYLHDGGPHAARLSACARLYDDYLQLVVPAESPVRGMTDLAGLRVGIGERRSGVSLVAGRLLKAAGMDRERDIRARAVGIDKMPDQLARGELDAFLWAGGLPTTAVERLATRAPIRLVQLGDLVPELRTMQPETRHYRAAVMPADAYPAIQQGEPVNTLAVANLLVTTDQADPLAVEALTRSLINSRDAIGNQVHAAQKVDLRTAIYTDPLPLHEGARRYYREVKP